MCACQFPYSSQSGLAREEIRMHVVEEARKTDGRFWAIVEGFHTIFTSLIVISQGSRGTS